MEMNDPTSGFRQRALLIFSVLAFIACYQWVYIHWLYINFSYLGYDYNPRSIGYMLLAWMLSALPSLWMPLTLARPSQLIYWVLYLTVFIPSMFVPLFAGINPPTEVAKLMLTLFVGFAITGISYRLPLLKLRSPRLPKSLFWYGFILVTSIFTVSLIVGFWGHLHIVSFSDIYDVRNEADTVMEGTLLNYPLLLLSCAINPFLMGWGLYHRRASLFVTGMLGQVLVYSCFGTKASVLAVLFVLGFYLLFRVGRIPFALKLTWALVALFVVLSLSFILAGDEPGLILTATLTLVFMRTFALPGLLTAEYYYFFQHNPLTYYSHLKGISSIITYPYNHYLGTEIGYYFYGILNDTTAHLWAMDGLAALGLPGILLVSAFCTFVFWMLDSFAQKHDPRLAALVITYTAYNMANLSMFTTLLSRGFGLLMVILYLMPREESKVSLEPMISASVAPAS